MTTFNDASDVPLPDMSSRYPDQDQISKRNSIVLNIKPVSTTINGDIVVSLIRTPDMAINDYGGIETEPCIDNADHGDRLNGELVILHVDHEDKSESTPEDSRESSLHVSKQGDVWMDARA